jgi:hypothetical protein
MQMFARNPSLAGDMFGGEEFVFYLPEASLENADRALSILPKGKGAIVLRLITMKNR